MWLVYSHNIPLLVLNEQLHEDARIQIYFYSIKKVCAQITQCATCLISDAFVSARLKEKFDVTSEAKS
jgi:hypothetical protein